MTRTFGRSSARSHRRMTDCVHPTDALVGRSTRPLTGSTERLVTSGLAVAGLSMALLLAGARAYAQSATPAPTPASAATQSQSDANPIATRILSDPLFLPGAGQAYGLSSFTLNQPSGTNTRAGVATGSFNASDSLFNQTLAYGITNSLTIRFAMGYASDTRDSTAAKTGDVTIGNSTGFSDPTFSATYRILDEFRSPLVLDLTASYSPNTFVSESAGAGVNGTIARGGQNTGLSFTLGREMTSFTIAGTVGTTYVGQQVTELLSNNTSSQSDAHWSYDAGLSTQTRFTDRVSLNAGVSYSTGGNYGVSNLQTGNLHTYDSPVTTAVTLALNYHFVPNRFVGSFTYEFDTYTEAQNLFAKLTADTAVINRTGNVVGFRVAYLFN